MFWRETERISRVEVGVSRRNDHENWKQETSKGSHTTNRSGTIGEIHECVVECV